MDESIADLSLVDESVTKSEKKKKKKKQEE